MCSCCGSGVLRGLYFSRSAGDIEFLCNKDNRQFSIRVQDPKSLTESLLTRTLRFLENPLSTRGRYDPLSFNAVNPITEIYWIYSSKIFTDHAGFYLLDRFPRKSIGNGGLLATEGMVDGWRVERLNSFLPPSRLNKTTFPSDGWKKHRRNYLSLLARTTSISLRGERRIIGRIVESCFFLYPIMHECREKYRHAFSNVKVLEYPRCFIDFFFFILFYRTPSVIAYTTKKNSPPPRI